MTTHSSIPAWRIPWAGAWWATVHGVAESDTTEQRSMQHIYNVSSPKTLKRSPNQHHKTPDALFLQTSPTLINEWGRQCAGNGTLATVHVSTQATETKPICCLTRALEGGPVIPAEMKGGKHSGEGTAMKQVPLHLPIKWKPVRRQLPIHRPHFNWTQDCPPHAPTLQGTVEGFCVYETTWLQV